MSLPLSIGIYSMEERVTAGLITSIVKFCPLFSLNYPHCLRLSFNLGCVTIISLLDYAAYILPIIISSVMNHKSHDTGNIYPCLQGCGVDFILIERGNTIFFGTFMHMFCTLHANTLIHLYM